MLIVKRKDGQTIQIGEEIIITIYSGPDAPQVKVGIDAPKDTLILRGELLDEYPLQDE